MRKATGINPRWLFIFGDIRKQNNPLIKNTKGASPTIDKQLQLNLGFESQDQDLLTQLKEWNENDLLGAIDILNQLNIKNQNEEKELGKQLLKIIRLISDPAPSPEEISKQLKFIVAQGLTRAIKNLDIPEENDYFTISALLHHHYLANHALFYDEWEYKYIIKNYAITILKTRDILGEMGHSVEDLDSIDMLDIFWGINLTQSIPWVKNREQSLSKNEILYLIQKELVDNA